MTPIHYACSSSYFMGLVGLVLYRTQLLSALLCLEAMMLILFISLSLWALQLMSTMFAACPMILLALSACEASAGLALLVATARSHGSGRLKNLSLLRC
ncbi:NADH dehydrogenase subunit 4L (mitochondrion) [Oryzias melastigma]|uniref:NADH-ubiquinone oxidoreductase chain 4L n=2 Tax=Oryzias TaxID=8089 RepID=J7F835_ORYME|nr:NADH dehydrogenase subunit 4L [Oryzias dancena]YP_006665917.1 NADH dehydrogenase subunit 4L [Oryzias melastigma]ACX70664.1 NADH dehydrogenase subunit 4L [Oryzias dancena]AFE62795.1 NADH dehydrogenase subunit 4L [Oryzias melastigma]BAH84953.1 NADH dehydrogenase subunit 4L [Oryzias dancena]